MLSSSLFRFLLFTTPYLASHRTLKATAYMHYPSVTARCVFSPFHSVSLCRSPVREDTLGHVEDGQVLERPSQQSRANLQQRRASMMRVRVCAHASVRVCVCMHVYVGLSKPDPTTRSSSRHGSTSVVDVENVLHVITNSSRSRSTSML